MGICPSGSLSDGSFVPSAFLDTCSCCIILSRSRNTSRRFSTHVIKKAVAVVAKGVLALGHAHITLLLCHDFEMTLLRRWGLALYESHRATKRMIDQCTLLRTDQ